MKTNAFLIYALLFICLGSTDAMAQRIRFQQVVCNSNGCYPAYQATTRTVFMPIVRPSVSSVVPRPVVVTAESEVLSPLSDLQFTASKNIAASDERSFIRELRQATKWGRQAGQITAFMQARILSAARLPRLGAEIEQMLAAEFGVSRAANGEYNWQSSQINRAELLIRIIELLIQLGVFRE